MFYGQWSHQGYDLKFSLMQQICDSVLGKHPQNEWADTLQLKYQNSEYYTSNNFSEILYFYNVCYNYNFSKNETFIKIITIIGMKREDLPEI